ncbi:cathepsin L-like [Chironomus tepperi]|uniref:cathepsin L-like n=1 Tax=Chironomus tepperi TaxID=113505 RepID=UPI00391F2913
MKSIIFITLALSVFEQPHQNDRQWLSYKDRFNKQYPTKQEEIIRYKNFKLKDDMINMHNDKYSKGQATYKMGHNQFSDMSQEEFKEIYLQSMKGIPRVPERIVNITRPAIPDEITYQDYCMPPLDQGNCGSCWAFASTAQVEAQLKRRDPNYNTYISPQYIMDCSGAGSCEGGVPEQALTFLKTNGFSALSDYKYDGQDEQCKNDVKKMNAEISSTEHDQLNGNEDDLASYVANHGPVVVSLFAPDSLSHYTEGIFSEDSCPNDCRDVNHAMVVVGYGSSELDYWLVKNSWSSSWGEDGYVKMIRNSDNKCNIACGIDFASVK